MRTKWTLAMSLEHWKLNRKLLHSYMSQRIGSENVCQMDTDCLQETMVTVLKRWGWVLIDPDKS